MNRQDADSSYNSRAKEGDSTSLNASLARPASPPESDNPALKRQKPNTKTACDRCRKRKIKCEDERPCSKCTAADEACVTTALDRIRYNTAHLDVKPTDDELALRKAQKASRPRQSSSNSRSSRRTPPLSISTMPTSASFTNPPLSASTTSARSLTPHGHHHETNTWNHGVYIDDSGSVVHSSSSSGLPLVERLGGLRQPDPSSNGNSNTASPPHMNNELREGPPPVDLSSYSMVEPRSTDVWPAIQECMPIDLLHSLIRNHLEGTECLAPILHQPHFTQRYLACCEGRSPCSPAFGGLLMAIAAASSRSLPYDIRVFADPSNPRSAGLRYFQRSRVLLRLPQDRLSLDYIQSLIYLSGYVEGLGDSTLHVMILAEAIGLALQTGLHREQSSFDPIQTETRKRTFFALYTLDKITSCAQGRTPMIKIGTANNPLPEAVDDIYITAEGVLSQPSNQPNVLQAAFNAMSQIMVIIEHILVFINAPHVLDNCDNSTSLLYSFRQSITPWEYHDKAAMLDKAEGFLSQWVDALPENLRLSTTLGRMDPDENPQQFVQSIRLAINHNFVQGLIARERIVLELNASGDSVNSLAYGEVAQKAADAATTIAQLFGVLDARGLIERYFSFQHVQHLAFAGHTLLSIMAVYQAVSADHIQVVESVLSMLESSAQKFASAVKASQLLRQIARGLKIQLKVPPPTDYGDRLRVRVVPQSRPPYELQRRSSLSSKGEQQDWTALAAQAYMPNSNGDIPLRIPAGIGGNAVFSQSSVRGSGNESSVMQSPQDEFPPPSSLLSNLLGEASASRPGTAGTFKPFNPWSPASATSGLPHDADAMSDLLAPFGLTYVDPLEDNFTSSNANGGLKDNLFGFMTNNFSTY